MIEDEDAFFWNIAFLGCFENTVNEGRLREDELRVCFSKLVYELVDGVSRIGAGEDTACCDDAL